MMVQYLFRVPQVTPLHLSFFVLDEVHAVSEIKASLIDLIKPSSWDPNQNRARIIAAQINESSIMCWIQGEKLLSLKIVRAVSRCRLRTMKVQVFAQSGMDSV